MVTLLSKVVFGKCVDFLDDIDYESVLQCAKEHKVSTFIYSELQAHESLSTATHEKIRQQKYQIAAHALRYFHELKLILQAFDAANISAVPFKGIPLSHQLYDDYHKRQFVDLDIFIQPCDVEKAMQILADSDYQLPALKNISASQFSEMFSSIEAFKKNRTIIDLQWDLSNQYALLWVEASRLMDYTELIEIDGFRIRAFNPELTLYLLGVHGAKNGFCELRYIVDLASFLIQHPHFDYAAFLAKAKRLGIDRFFTVGASLCHSFFQVEYPAAFSSFIRPASEKLADKIIHSVQKSSKIPVGFEGFIIACRFKSNFKELFRYIFYRIRPTKGDVHKGGSGLNSYVYRMRKVLSIKG